MSCSTQLIHVGIVMCALKCILQEPKENVLKENVENVVANCIRSKRRSHKRAHPRIANYNCTSFDVQLVCIAITASAMVPA